ncbi:MAG: AraC family transcriptional regulator [Leadbetterella sp.]|nr:AraC family transcriptional regulator [Leadbetterella sp.]
MISLTPSFSATRKLVDIVENRTVHTLNSAELNIYETHRKTEDVHLKFTDPLLVSMIRGKKVMNLSNMDSFGFLPGESVALPSDELMRIDFPEATLQNPTQCLALAISRERLEKTVDFLNQNGGRVDGTEWKTLNFNYRFANDIAINQIIQRLIFIFTENHPSKDIFSEMLLHELVIRILQFENRTRYDVNSKQSSNADAFSHVIRFIRENLTEDLSVEILSRIACMSESKFYRSFRNETGLTPNEFIIEERLKLAENLLIHPEVSVKEAWLASGFNSFSYFSTLFKKRKKLTPSEFKTRMGQ